MVLYDELEDERIDRSALYAWNGYFPFLHFSPAELGDDVPEFEETLNSLKQRYGETEFNDRLKNNDPELYERIVQQLQSTVRRVVTKERRGLLLAQLNALREKALREDRMDLYALFDGALLAMKTYDDDENKFLISLCYASIRDALTRKRGMGRG